MKRWNADEIKERKKPLPVCCLLPDKIQPEFGN